MSDQDGNGTEHDEPARVWEVSCTCGYEEMFRHEEDAREVFDAHSTNWGEPRCGSASMEAMHAYPKGGVDPEETMPYDYDEDPLGLTEPEVLE